MSDSNDNIILKKRYCQIKKLEKYLHNDFCNKNKFLFLITIFDHSFSIDYFYKDATEDEVFEMEEDFVGLFQFYSVEELKNIILKIFDRNIDFVFRFNWKYPGCKLSFREEKETDSKSDIHKKFVLDHFDKVDKDDCLEIIFSFQDEKVKRNYLCGNYQYNDVTRKVYEAECLLKLFLKQNHVNGLEESNLLFPKSVYQSVRGISYFYSLPELSDLSHRISCSLLLTCFFIFATFGALSGTGILMLMGLLCAIPSLLCFFSYGIEYLQKKHGEKIALHPDFSFCVEDISRESKKNFQNHFSEEKIQEDVFEDIVLQEIDNLLDKIEGSCEEVRREVLSDAKKILVDYLNSFKEISTYQDVFGHADDYFILKSETIANIALLEEKFEKLEREQKSRNKFGKEVDRISQKIDNIELDQKNLSSLRKNKRLVLTKENIRQE